MPRGNITQRFAVSMANRPAGWTAREAQRAHRRANAKAVKAQKRA